MDLLELVNKSSKNMNYNHLTLVCNVGAYFSANQPVARHFNSGSHCISDMKIRALCPFLVATIAAKDRKCVSFPNLEPYTPLLLTSVFPSFSVTCLRLTCSDIGRSNPTFVLLALCMLSHITPIFNPVYKI